MAPSSKAAATHVQIFAVTIKMGKLTSFSKNLSIYCDENGVERFLITEFNVKPTLEMDNDAYRTIEDGLASMKPVYTSATSKSIYSVNASNIKVLSELYPYTFYQIEPQ